MKGTLALVHNGNLVNALELEYTGAIFQTTIDSEAIACHIAGARINTPNVECAVAESMKKLKGAGSLIIMKPQKLDGVQRGSRKNQRSSLSPSLLFWYGHSLGGPVDCSWSVEEIQGIIPYRASHTRYPGQLRALDKEGDVPVLKGGNGNHMMLGRSNFDGCILRNEDIQMVLDD